MKNGLVMGQGEERTTWESHYLRSIFPEEIWQKIFDDIQDPSVLENISNASPYLRELLSPRRVLFLFPKVFEILAVQYDEKHEIDPAFNEAAQSTQSRTLGQGDATLTTSSSATVVGLTCESCGRTRTPQWYSGILKLRLICQNWNMVIDNRLNGLAGNILLLGLNANERNRRSRRGFIAKIQHENYGFSSQTPTGPRQFVQHFQASHPNGAQLEDPGRSPFLTGGIILNLVNGRMIMENANAHRIHIDGFTDFGRSHGLYVQNLKISIRSEFTSALVVLVYLCHLTMCNLRILSISSSEEFDAGLGPFGAWAHDNNLQNHFYDNPNPPLKFGGLQHLQTKWLYPPIFNALIRANGYSLSTLVVVRNQAFDQYNIYDVPMPLITQLSIAFYSMADFQKLEGPQVNWMLRDLHLDVQALPKYTPLSGIFHLLSGKWADTLKSLCLELPSASTSLNSAARAKAIGRYKTDLINAKLNLPQMRHLTLTMETVLILDFILHMKNSLEILEIKVKYLYGERYENTAQSAEDGSEIKLLSYCGRIHESNVWELFPKLEQVKLCFNREESTCTRREWRLKTKKD